MMTYCEAQDRWCEIHSIQPGSLVRVIRNEIAKNEAGFTAESRYLKRLQVGEVYDVIRIWCEHDRIHYVPYIVVRYVETYFNDEGIIVPFFILEPV